MDRIYKYKKQSFNNPLAETGLFRKGLINFIGEASHDQEFVEAKDYDELRAMCDELANALGGASGLLCDIPCDECCRFVDDVIDPILTKHDAMKGGSDDSN